MVDNVITWHLCVVRRSAGRRAVIGAPRQCVGDCRQGQTFSVLCVVAMIAWTAVGMDCSDTKDFKERTLRTLKQGLGRLWRRRSVTISEYDPSYKVVYLGNVLTGWAKGKDVHYFLPQWASQETHSIKATRPSGYNIYLPTIYITCLTNKIFIYLCRPIIPKHVVANTMLFSVVRKLFYNMSWLIRYYLALQGNHGITCPG